MVKVAVGLMSVAAMIAAIPAMAHGQVIPNDLERCGGSRNGPAVLVDVRGFAAETGKLNIGNFVVLPGLCISAHFLRGYLV